MHHKISFSLFLLILATGLLGGCESISQTFGLSRDSQDPLAVQDRPALTLPPAFYETPGSSKPKKDTKNLEDLGFVEDALHEHNAY